MIAVLGTLAFLVVGWTALYAAIITGDVSGEKIVAALKGKSLAAEPKMLRGVTVRFATRSAMSAKPVRAKAEWRAAA